MLNQIQYEEVLVHLLNPLCLIDNGEIINCCKQEQSLYGNQ
jgi:hypothetical protein